MRDAAGVQLRRQAVVGGEALHLLLVGEVEAVERAEIVRRAIEIIVDQPRAVDHARCFIIARPLGIGGEGDAIRQFMGDIPAHAPLIALEAVEVGLAELARWSILPSGFGSSVPCAGRKPLVSPSTRSY